MNAVEMLEHQVGTSKALLVLMLALVATHQDRETLAKAIRLLAESDLEVLIAMSSAGKPKIQQSFREVIEGVLRFAENPGGAQV
jgi:hypothetical protein